MSTELWFPLGGALRLAEHAAAAPAQFPSLSEHLDGLTCPGAIEWVADAGTYLMSSGDPGLRADPANPHSNTVVYAEGYGPGTDLRGTDIGAGDFAEHLHLGDTEPASLRRLRAAAAQGYRWLVLEVTETEYSVRFARTKPAAS
ncbi:MAG: hypothetical protein QOJ50_1902 [Cryptosporangiaceae bacterium]|jgi:hypothetical protein|nr:hypothetical protein [Cryptosporangiaceae bacterium]